MSSFMGGGHRSSSDRLLNNYMDSQKGLTTALLTLLSHSHTSTSSLLAYVTSSPGVLLPIRRAVRHAAFEGPLSPGDQGTGGTSSIMGDGDNLGWAAYVSSLEDFRKNLKKIHELEEEMSRVKRDRQILVSRLIKTTKSRPTKRDIKDMSSSLSTSFRHNDGGSVLSSAGSAYSYSSDMSGHVSSREAKRAQKMQEAQAELLGCEEHLRSLEVRIESERNKVMYSGLEERFHAMEAVGQMWIAQARRGLHDLERLPADGEGANYELESNASLAPSQSASQMGFDERDFSPVAHKHSRSLTAGRRGVARGPGSINESIAEEEEGGGSSEDEQPPTNLVMHENTRVTEANLKANNATSSPAVSRRHSHTGSKGTARKASSELGTGGTYRPPGTKSLRRTRSSDHGLSRVDERSETSSVNANTSAYHRGKEKKKGGFFSSIARFFKGPHHDGQENRSGRESPYRKGNWHTRTDDNIKRAKSLTPRTRRADSSSDEESLRNFSVVANQPNAPSWTVADVGRVSVNHGNHPGLVRSPSTKARSHAGSATPRAAMSVVSKTPTVKSSKSNRSTGKPKTRTNGSIARTSKPVSSPHARADNSMMSIVDPSVPNMPDVPKAPSVGPQMELAKAPGSSLAGNTLRQQPAVHHTARHSTHSAVHQAPPLTHNTTPKKKRDTDTDTLRPQDSISRSNSMRTGVSAPGRPHKSPKRRSSDSFEKPPVSAQPPSKLKPPPLKSALRPTSPSPAERQLSPDPRITTLYSVHAPGPVQVDEKEIDYEEHHMGQKPAAPEIAGLITDGPNDKPDIDRPRTKSRASYTTGTTGESVYESAEDDATRQYNEGNIDDDATEIAGYQPSAYSDGNDLSRRKSVRVHVPGEAPAPAPVSNNGDGYRETKTTNYITPVPDSAPRESMDSDDLSPRRAPQDWGTRIGRMREDTSSEEDELDPTYAKARKHLIKNDGNFEKLKSKSKSKSGKSGSSIRSKGSSRSKSSRK